MAVAQAMKTALRHGGSRPSLHYVSTSVGNGLDDHHRRQRQPDLGGPDDRRRDRGAKATMIIELVGQEAYSRGDATAIEVLINLTARQSATAAGQWVSVVRSTRSTRALPPLSPSAR